MLEAKDAVVDASDPIVEAVSLPGSSSGSCKGEEHVSWGASTVSIEEGRGTRLPA